jgi:hypothetical protein
LLSPLLSTSPSPTTLDVFAIALAILAIALFVAATQGKGKGVKTPSLPPPSTAAKVDDTAIGPVSSIPPPPPSTMTTITALNDCHLRCHTVNNNNRQKPVVIGCCQRWQWQSSSTEVADDGGHGDGGLC